jgi:hypothetical protein
MSSMASSKNNFLNKLIEEKLREPKIQINNP